MAMSAGKSATASQKPPAPATPRHGDATGPGAGYLA